MRFSHEEAVGGWEHDREFETEAEYQEAFRQFLTVDLASQLAGEETDGLPQEVKDKLSIIPEQVKREVSKAHQDLGHPSKTALI